MLVPLADPLVRSTGDWQIVFALAVTQLMGIVGLIFAGGLLLLWVAWKFWRELRHGGESAAAK